MEPASKISAYWPSSVSDTPLPRILLVYSSPSRHYHNLSHLHEVLSHLTLLLHSAGTNLPATTVDAVYLAAFYHDAVYEGLFTDESASAELAASDLSSVGASTALVEEVKRLVMVTCAHEPDLNDLAGQILSDADLGILGADKERYEVYTLAVREEYIRFNDAEFCTGRLKVLDKLLQGNLYQTEVAKSLWEKQARGNLINERKKLRD